MSADDEQDPQETGEARPPAAEKPAAEKPASEKAAGEKAPAKATAAKTAAAKEPAGKESAAKKPATKAKAAKDKAKVEQAGESPQAEGAAAEKPAAAKKAKAAAKKPSAKAEPAAGGAAGQPAKAPVAKSNRATVRAHARYVRTSARKARMVCGHLRGKSVQEARAILAFTPRDVARDWSKLLESAVANAENNHELLEDDLLVREAYADEGPTIKRFRPRAMGRATPIRKRTSHLTITLTPRA
jgi:ribosomal protein L22